MHALSEAAPPKIKNFARPSLAVFAGVVCGIAVLGACAVLFFFDPSKNNFYPACLFHQLTGLNCPGCGATRALYALLHGNVALALRDNALFILTLAVMVARGGWFAVKKILRRPAGNFFPPHLLWTFLALALAFGILRNLPACSFLSP